MKEKEFNQMNIEELRTALSEVLAENAELKTKLEKAKNDSDVHKTFWTMAEDEKRKMESQIAAIKAVVGLF